MAAVVASGHVRAVRGAVLDVTFESAHLPAIDEALHVGDGLIAEVQSHLDATSVRAISLQATSGLSRGTQVHATGSPLTAPVGDPVLPGSLGGGEAGGCRCFVHATPRAGTCNHRRGTTTACSSHTKPSVAAVADTSYLANDADQGTRHDTRV